MLGNRFGYVPTQRLRACRYSNSMWMWFVEHACIYEEMRHGFKVQNHGHIPPQPVPHIYIHTAYIHTYMYIHTYVTYVHRNMHAWLIACSCLGSQTSILFKDMLQSLHMLVHSRKSSRRATNKVLYHE